MAQSKPRMAKPSVGIDLGTTYSCVAVFQNGRPEVIANSQGSRITPSVVAFTKERRLIGEGASIQRKLDPSNAIYNAKKFIGRTWDDPAVQASQAVYPFKVIEDNKKIKFEVKRGTKSIKLTPEEIAAAILMKMKKIAEDYLEETVEDVVITVPAYFTDSQRQATVNAGKIAGLKVTRIINEPTAAAMAYGLREGTSEDEGKHILVYDLGGGTFDVSVLEIEEDLIQVKATAGNTNLGGESFNDFLVSYFKEEIIRKYNYDLTSNCRAIRRLTGACEKLKRNLSSENVRESKLELDNFLPNGKDFVSTLTRAKFENLCKETFDETIKCVDQALQDAQLSQEDIDEIVLVGGSSRIPKLQSMLSSFFNNKILNKSINPDEAVACGAAIQAAIINNDPHLTVKDMLLMDVIPLSIGVDGIGGITTIVVERNSTIPVRRTITPVTRFNNQTTATFCITEGERTMTEDNKILGSFTIDGLPPGKAGEIQFDMIFEIDENGILKVSATLQGTNKKAGITLNPRSSGKMSDEEVKVLIKQAEMMKMCDQKEENRMLSMAKLTSLCHHLNYVSQDLSETDVGGVLRSVDICLTWIIKHPDAEESEFVSMYNVINDEASHILAQSAVDDHTLRSSHVLRMGHQKAKFCLKAGKELLMSNSTNDRAKAAENFLKAYKIANEGGNLFKQIEALVWFGHTKKIMSATVSDLQEKLVHALDSVKILSFVLDLEKSKTLSEDERKTVLENIEYAANAVFETIANLEDEKKFSALYILMHSLDNNNAAKNSAFCQIVFQCRVKELNMLVKKVSSCLANENVKDSQTYISNLNYPKEQAKLLAKSQEEKQQLNEVLDAIQFSTLHTEGLLLINLAAYLLDGVDIDHPDCIDKALMALDHLSDAKQLTKEELFQVCIKANFFEGKIFMDYIQNTSKAKACFENVVTSSERYNLKTDEYRQSKYLLEEIQKKQLQEDERNSADNQEKLLNELQQDLQKIEEADNSMSDHNFIDFLFSEYPPKHKEKCKKPVITANASNKKAYIRLSTFYHPDKVDASLYGEKYKALCGEISKYVNGRFLKM